MAFKRPQTGRILVAGHDLGDMRLRDYRSHMGVVLQDNFLFDGTIAENIAFAKPGATLDEIRAVAHVAHCDEFIEGFPDKYDTIVGERGVKLSGGQRQRVAIARAILADPKILILDEATSSLDSESEQEIHDGLRALRDGAHDVRDRAPALDDPERRSDSRARARRDCRARPSRGAARAQRPLPTAVRQAVPDRTGSVHQSRRGFHACRSRCKRRLRSGLFFPVSVEPSLAIDHGR